MASMDRELYVEIKMYKMDEIIYFLKLKAFVQQKDVFILLTGLGKFNLPTMPSYILCCSDWLLHPEAFCFRLSRQICICQCPAIASLERINYYSDKPTLV